MKTDAAVSAAKTRANASVATGFMNRAAGGMRKMKAQKRAQKARRQQMIASMQPMSADISGLASMLSKGGYTGKDVASYGAGPGSSAVGGVDVDTSGITNLGGDKAGKLAAMTQGVSTNILGNAEKNMGAFRDINEQCANFVDKVLDESGFDIGVTKKAYDGLESGAALASRYSGDDIGTKLSKDQLQAGDIVTFNNTYGNWAPGTITHVGIYAGDGMIYDHNKKTGGRKIALDHFGDKFAHGIRPHAYSKKSNTSVPKLQEESGGPAAKNGGTLSYGQVKKMATYAGASHPDLVAAQWALESGHGKSKLATTHNNLFGQKGKGVYMPTQEDGAGGMYNTKANFKKFASPQDSVNFLVDNWHKDSRFGSGVNSYGTAAEAADGLVSRGYATDRNYAGKLKSIMNQYAEN
jgi:cell wall-associated NlpC family hydrolase